jgi:hypothetical protein
MDMAVVLRMIVAGLFLRNLAAAHAASFTMAFSGSQREKQRSPSALGAATFNLLRRAVRHPSQCSHKPVCDDWLSVALFLSVVVR